MSNWPFKILVKYASRGRPERFFEGMETIYSLCSQPDFIRVLITCDLDDETMNNDEVKERISKYKNTHVVFGESEGKVHATNRDMDIMPGGWKDWDIVCNFSDDQRWVAKDWDDLIRIDFNYVSPDFSHYIAYLDADTKGALSTLFIAGRKWYDTFGFIYDPRFKSLFCDNLVEDAARHLGKYHFTGYTIYKHLCPSYGHILEDAMFRKQQDIGWSIDQWTYGRIKEAGIENYLKQFNTTKL